MHTAPCHPEHLKDKSDGLTLLADALHIGIDGGHHRISVLGRHHRVPRSDVPDPAFLQVILHRNGLPMTQIAVGDNLLKHKTVELLIRSNRMIKVIRGISARELYLSSQLLSRYIRETITSGA